MNNTKPSRELTYIVALCAEYAASGEVTDDGLLDLFILPLLLAAHFPSVAGNVLEELSSFNPARVKELRELVCEAFGPLDE